jgi:predicted enzyme related to lactoylglutathione lyase
MKFKLFSVYVDNQEKALKFYTEVLGFTKHSDFPVGEARWLTLSSEGAGDVELVLEPNSNPISSTYQQALFQAGIPAMGFAVEDIQAEYARLKQLGVAFHQEPTSMGPVTVAVFDDTCGNLVQLIQG